ncbi:MAG: C39 family peptidase [Candidatus Rokuibacteriota bacterium]
MRFELSVLTGDGWSPWATTETVGSASFTPLPDPAPGLRADVDVFTAAAPAEAVRLRLRLRADDAAALLAAPWLLTLSACDLARPAPAAEPVASARLDVPALSQMREGGALGARVCSPASVAMVLAYWGADDSVARLAAEMFHPALDIYGVWPAGICAAGRRGVLGYLLRFPDWAAARWCLDRGLPIIASVRYAAGELVGAAVEETPGHLLVLTGYEGEEVLVNDPAALDTASVPRRYRLAHLTRVWLERAGVGYVLFRA